MILLEFIKRGLAYANTQILPLTPAISERAINLIDTYALTSGLKVADALIGATALENNLSLLTCNVKHFAPIDQLKIEPFEV